MCIRDRGNSKENLKADFFKKNILHHGALLDKYATWADGQYLSLIHI